MKTCWLVACVLMIYYIWTQWLARNLPYISCIIWILYKKFMFLKTWNLVLFVWISSFLFWGQILAVVVWFGDNFLSLRLHICTFRVWNHIAHLRQQCHNSKFVIFQEKPLKVLKCYNFLWVQQRHNCCPAVSFANCVMTLCLLKVHLQTFLSVLITQKCQILSCDTLVANEQYIISNSGYKWRWRQ